MLRKYLVWVTAAMLACGWLACHDDDLPGVDDVGIDEPDTEEDVDVDDGPDPVDRVEIDVDSIFDEAGQGFVRAARVEVPEDHIHGEVSQSQDGDWLLENDHGRYLIGLGSRAVGPCSWDGNPIETEAIIDGEPTGSVLGEICLLINVAQTIRPEYAEIIEDGSEGRAIVAVTSTIGPLDFLNPQAMMKDIAPGLYDFLHLDPERSPPFVVTVYYVLTPESRSLRVLTAIRNDGDQTEYFNAIHLVLSGSTGSFFNPISGRKGWGFQSLGEDNLSADPVSFVGYFSDHAGYAFVPDVQDHMEAELPIGAGMVGISGVIAAIHGTTNLLGLLTASELQMPEQEGYIELDPEGITTIGYRLYPSDGSVSTVTDQIYPDLGVETVTVSGRVVDDEGVAQSGVQITPLLEGDRAYSMVRTDEEGQFSMKLPLGQWELRARDEGRLTRVFDVQTAGADVELGDIALDEPATVTIRVRTPQGQPTPARVVVACVDGCGEMRPDSREIDTKFRPPGGWLQIVEIGVDGDAQLRLAEGDYRISVNRGMTWTTWPQDATETGGVLVEVDGGQELVLDAEIAEVVDTSGLLSADFHVHAMASPDASTSNEQRVMDFLAGGLDVMVSSDHDAVVDFQPTIDALGASQHITSVVGNEITTSNLGHINAFPLEYREGTRRGGAIDWSRGGSRHLMLQELVDEIRAEPGEQVVQLNHPQFPMGAIGLLEVDVLTGHSFADREMLNMPDGEVDPDTGDTGLWTDDFDAIEVYNGFGMSSFWSGFRWWLTMVGRGFSPTATAVSDTHGIYGSLGASPRSFVVVDEGSDTPGTMDLDHFVERIQKGALLGTGGPMMRVEVVNQAGQSAGMGDVLDASEGQATARVTLEMPEWIDVDTLDMYKNIPLDQLEGDVPGEEIEDPVEPTRRIEISWGDEHRELVAENTYEHYRRRQVVEVELEIESDSYVVFVARGLNGRQIRPVISSGARPLAFSNPVFLDFDGGGYDSPPLLDARLERLEGQDVTELQRRRVDRVIIDYGDEITAEKVGRVIEALRCDHSEQHGHDHHFDHDHDHEHHGHDHHH